MTPFQTKEAIEIEDNEVGTLIEEKPKVDPRVTRWGFNWLFGVSMEPRKTSVKSTYIPRGKWFPITTFETPHENFTMDEFKPKEENKEVFAASGEAELKSALEIWGFKSDFYSELSKPMMTAISAALIPSLSEIREICEVLDANPIGNRCIGEDESDIGDGRELCATCHLAWLKSDECSAYLAHIAENGIAVRTTRDGALKTITVKPVFDTLERARKIVKESISIYIRKAAEEWAKIIGELDGKLRTEIKAVEHAYRKDLHQPKPTMKEIEAATRMAEANADANAEVFQQLADTTESLVKSQAANSDMMAQMMLQNQQFMQQNQQFMQTMAQMMMKQSIPTGETSPVAEISAPPEEQPSPKITPQPKKKAGE